nr:PREDICTED: uncharacterized protein LOC109035274 [Bemisia tabaci]
MLLIPLILLLVFADKIAASEKGTKVLSTDIEVEDEFATVRNNPDPKDKLWPFTKTDRDRVNLLGQPYDFDSIMNYDMVAFSKDQSQFDTIRAKNGQKMSSCHFKNEISVGDVKKLQELYRCKGVQQKPCFPVDIVCHFNQNKCGFKEVAHWIWVFRTDPELETVGYLECKLDVTVSLEDYIRSINFHGLSPRDSKRGPNGCIKFMYQFVGYRHGHLSLEVLRIGLESTFDFVDAPPKDAISIWSTTVKARSTKWVRVSFPVNVSTPFALHFKFKLLDGTERGSVKVDDFEVRYTACDHPSHATPPDKSKIDLLKSLPNKAIKSMRPPSLKLSSSKRRRAASASSDGSKVGWLRSWSTKLSRLRTFSSFGSFRSSFESPSSNSFSISTPDSSKFSTES